MSKARYVMIGGFLGAGKTTAVLRIAEQLHAQGRRVGLITNDQSYGLVDTALLGAHGFPVEEITGGCFCCRFNSLVEAADRLTAAARPDVFIAEPVGSCTDLKATVDYPLRRMYGADYSLAPLSVMVDPVRAARILGLEPGKSFSRKVIYIYEKQLEEADVIVINKTDLLPADRLERLRGALQARFPKAELLRVSARHGTGMAAWLERLAGGEARAGAAMEVDYDVYAEGEALLGWLNCAARVAAAAPFDGNALLRELAGEIRRVVEDEGGEIAHLKLTLTPEEDAYDIGVVNLVRNDLDPEASHSLQEDLEAGELLLNLRAEASPESLRSLTRAALDRLAGERGLRVAIEHMESFRPARPTPTHRLTTV